MSTRKALEGPIDAVFTEFDGRVEDISGLQDDLDNEMRTFESEMNADPNDQTLYFKVYKEIKGMPKPAHCFNGNSADLPIDERLRSEFGTGLYIINLVKNNKLYRKFKLPILAPQTVAPAQSQNNDLASVLKVMAENQERQFNQLKEVLLQGSGRQVTPTDPMQNMQGLLAIMLQMKELTAQPVTPQNSLRDTIETIGALKELIPERGGGETNWMDVITKALESPLLSVAAQQLAMKPAATNVITTSRPAPQASQPTQTVQSSATVHTTAEEINNMQMQEIIERINKLVKKAAMDGDPGVAAIDLIEDFGEEDKPDMFSREGHFCPQKLRSLNRGEEKLNQ